MHLLRMRVSGLGPFDELELDLSNDDGDPRLMTVVYGGGGVGKTTLLAALASTRPGNAVVNSTVGSERETPGAAVCEYRLGQDDPERPHVLVVASPNVRVCTDDNAETLRRREQALFDRVARESGFVFVAIGSQRWFSRQPVALIGPGRSGARYEVRSSMVERRHRDADVSHTRRVVSAAGPSCDRIVYAAARSRVFMKSASGPVRASRTDRRSDRSCP